jgi:hypothetical protein
MIDPAAESKYISLDKVIETVADLATELEHRIRARAACGGNRAAFADLRALFCDIGVAGRKRSPGRTGVTRKGQVYGGVLLELTLEILRLRGDASELAAGGGTLAPPIKRNDAGYDEATPMAQDLTVSHLARSNLGSRLIL